MSFQLKPKSVGVVKVKSRVKLTSNKIPSFPLLKKSHRSTDDIYGCSISGLSGAKLLSLLLKSNIEIFPTSICHCKNSQSELGCTFAESWISTWFEDFEFREKQEEYHGYKTFGLGRILSGVYYRTDGHQSVKYKQPKATDEFIHAYLMDASRTFVSYQMFKHINMLKKAFNVMVAIHQKYQSLKYVQGMNFIVAALCIHCDETVAFFLFSHILDDLGMAEMYDDIDLLLQKATEISEKIESKMNVTELSGFVSSWIMTLLSHLVPLEYSEKLFDSILLEGWEGFESTVISIFSVLQEPLSYWKNFGDFAKILKGLSKPPNHHAYALESQITESSPQWFQYWDKIFS